MEIYLQAKIIINPSVNQFFFVLEIFDPKLANDRFTLQSIQI